MDEKRKLSMIEELLELDNNILKSDSLLSDFEEWDSIARLSLMIILDEEFGRKITGKEIKAFERVQDILDVMV